jgi:hypothetical protein
MGAFWREFGVTPREFLEDLEEWELAVGAWYLNELADADSDASGDGSPSREMSVEQARLEGLV